MKIKKRPTNHPTNTPAPALEPQQVVVHRQQQYSGSIPPPSMLGDFDALVPGTAARLIQWAEDEAIHRRRLESEGQAANINAQSRNLELAEYQSKAIFKAELIGQLCGLVVCLGFLGGSIYAGVKGNTPLAVALAAFPAATVVYAFRGKIFGKDKP
jgi:uncharacterized membrane protein